MAVSITEPVRVVRLHVRREGDHAWVRVFIGQEPHPGCCGELVMRREDWLDFTQGRFKAGEIRYEGDTQAWLSTLDGGQS